MDLQRIATILLRRWWLVLGMPVLVLGISLVLLSTSPYVASIRASVLIPGDTQETGNAERPELMVLDDVTQLVGSPVFATAVSAQLQQSSPQYALPASDVQAALSADYYSRIVTIRATRPSDQEALALVEAARQTFENQVNAVLIAPGGQPATVRLVAPATVGRDSPATGTVALVIQTLVALAIGCGLAALAAAFDQRIHSRSDAATVIPVPVLGDLRFRPASRTKRRSGRRESSMLPATDDPPDLAESNHSHPDEPLRALRATLEATAVGRSPEAAPGVRVWLVASVDGNARVASSLVRELGASYAAAGERCLVFDASQDQGDEGNDGSPTPFTAWLTGSDDVPPPLPIPSRDGASDVVDIRPIPDGRDVMRGPRWDVALAVARATYDVILVGVRPLGSSADGLALARHVEAIVLLVRVGRTGGSALVQARAALLAAGGTIAGTVLVSAD